ncbi:MAG: FHA domain-containing protein [Planctomycetota bacterium]
MASQGVRVRLILLSGSRVGEECEVIERVLLGRQEDCDLRIDDPQASRKHARVSVTPGGVYLEDLGSSNGTKLHGERVRQARLDDGDEILIGSTLLKVRIEPELRSPPAEQAAAPVGAGPSGPARSGAVEGVEEIDLDDLGGEEPEAPAAAKPTAGPAARGPVAPAPRPAPGLRPQSAKAPAAPKPQRPPQPMAPRPPLAGGRGRSLGDDLSQRSWAYQLVMILVALAAAIGLFWLAYHAVA